MYDKFLFVGLGGSGGKTLRFLKREIQRWSTDCGFDGKVPAGWQFLHVDTPVNPDGDEINHKVAPLSADEYLGLIAPGTELRDVQGRLDADQSIYPELLTWRVEPAATDVPVQQGAGQMRAIGQTVAMACVGQIREHIEARVSRMTGGTATAELAEMYHAATDSRAASNSSTYVVVVSSLAGGTGAGLLNLVSNVIRALNTPAGDNVFAVLYTPEVFGSLGSAATAGVYPNSLAAMSELLNGHWWQGSEDNAIGLASPRENALLKRAGLPAPQARSGPRFPFLVGRVGAGGVDFGSPDRLFEMTARSLASWVTPTADNSGFVQYTVGNWNTLAKDGRQQHGILVDEGDPHEQGLPPMSALGFSRLSVGAEYLGEYAVQRIGKDVLRHLARHHSESDDAESIRLGADTDDPDYVLTEMADRALPAFMGKAKLAESGPDHNDIQDALTPDRENELLRRLEDDARSLADLESGEQRSSEQWAAHLRQAVSQAQAQFESSYRTELDASTQQWIHEQEARTIEAMAGVVADKGLAVAAEVAGKAKNQLESDIREELLNSDAPRYHSWAADIRTAINDKLSNGGRKIKSDHANVEEALLEAVHYAGYAGKAMVAERAAHLATDLAHRVLGPLQRSLNSATSAAELDLTTTDTWVGWSSDKPPSSVRPPVGDFPLIDPDTYPDLFTELTAGDIGTSVREIDQRIELRRQIILGSFGGSGNEGTSGDGSQTCISVRKSWYPEAQSVLGGSKAATDVRVVVETGLAELRTRTEKWLKREGSSWHRHLSMTIRQYVGSDDPLDPLQLDEATIRSRRARFDAQFSAAVLAASPFISLDAGLMGPVHQSAADEKPNLSFSPIPLGSHPTEEQVRSRLVEHGVSDGRISGMLNNDSAVTRIDITGQLAAPVSPLVVESLMRPISERWGQATNGPQRRKFWEWRRAQPLESFIPASQALIRCMVRGWYSAQMLGLVAEEADSFKIASRAKRQPVGFPPHLLSQARDSGPRDWLAMILESLALAYVESSRIGGLGPLDAYIALRELGRSGSGSSLFGYQSLSPELEHWVQTGETDGYGVGPLSAPLAGSTFGANAASPADRSAALVKFCKDTHRQYSEEFNEHNERCVRHPELLSKAPLWTGLWVRHLGPAMSDIATAAAGFAAESGGRPAPKM